MPRAALPSVPTGYLYVAEAGTGGSNQTDPQTCLQVPAPVGPYSGGSNGRISKISPSHTVTTVASGFPSAQDALGDLIGVADVKFVDGTLYALSRPAVASTAILARRTASPKSTAAPASGR